MGAAAPNTRARENDPDRQDGKAASMVANRTSVHAVPVIDVILNRNARALAGDGPLRATFLAAAARGGARVHETRTLDDLAEAARDIAARGSDGVVLGGGDGSHMAGLSALARACGDALPPIGLAPGGTVGTVGRNLGLRGPAGSRAERLVAAACEGRARVTAQPTLRVRDDGGGDRVGFIFGAGLAGRFFERYDASPERGLATAAWLAVRVFVGSLVGAPFAQSILEPVPCSLEVDEVVHPAPRWSLILASVVPDLGLHLRATYRAGEAYDRFHVVASGLGPRGLAAELPRVLAGRPLRGTPRVDALARTFVVRFARGAATYLLDGDLQHAETVRVECGPVLRLLLP
jgi:diacylglycerol kinase (ATP)